jgi:hypothetical protein
MQNLLLYYKYVIRVQYLLKHPAKRGKNLIQSFIKKILLEIYMEDVKNNYYIYLYNISILIRLLINKFLYVKYLRKSFNINKIYLGISLKKNNIYQFLDVFTTLLLPLFESFNMYLDLKKFDIFGNLTYNLMYFDPVFMSKNTVTA